MTERHKRWLKIEKWLAGLALLATLAAAIAAGVMFNRNAKQALSPGVTLALFGSLALTGGVLVWLDVRLAQAVKLYPGFKILKMGKREGARVDFRPGLYDAVLRGEIKSMQQGRVVYQVPSACCLCMGKADAKPDYEASGGYSYRERGRKYDVTRTFRFEICQACTVINGVSGRMFSAVGASLIVVGVVAIYAHLRGDVAGIGAQFVVLLAALILPALPAGGAVSRAHRPVDVLAKDAQLQVANAAYAAKLVELNPKWKPGGTGEKRMAASAR